MELNNDIEEKRDALLEPLGDLQRKLEDSSKKKKKKKKKKRKLSSSNSSSPEKQDKLFSDVKVKCEEDDQEPPKKRHRKPGELSKVDMQLINDCPPDLTSARPSRSSFLKAVNKLAHTDDLDYESRVVIPIFKHNKPTKELRLVLRNLKDETDPEIMALYQSALESEEEVLTATQNDHNYANKPPKSPKLPGSVDPLDYRVFRISKYISILETLFESCGHFPQEAEVLHQAPGMIAGLLNWHRSICSRCDKVLNKLNVGFFKGLGPFQGFVGQSGKPDSKIDEGRSWMHWKTQYENTVEELRVAQDKLAEKISENAKLRKRIQIFSKATADIAKKQKTDNLDTMDLVELLDGVQTPSRHMTSVNDQYVYACGYRLIDLRVLRSALTSSQMCPHKKLTLVEHTTYNSRCDLATKMAFFCPECGPKASFTSSPISQCHPENYSVNKMVLPLLGPEAYYKLVNFVQQDNPRIIMKRSSLRKSVSAHDTLMLSYDKTLFDFRRPFEPTTENGSGLKIRSSGQSKRSADQSSDETDEDNIIDHQIADKVEISADQVEIPADQVEISADQEDTSAGMPKESSESPGIVPKQPNDNPKPLLSLKPLSSLMGTPQKPKTSQSHVVSRFSSLEPIELQPPTLRVEAHRAEPVDIEQRNKHPSIDSIIVEKNIAPSTHLPSGSKLVSVPAGTRLVSTNVVQTTTKNTGLRTGVYKVTHKDYPEKVLVVTDSTTVPCRYELNNQQPDTSLQIADGSRIVSQQPAITNIQSNTQNLMRRFAPIKPLIPPSVPVVVRQEGTGQAFQIPAATLRFSMLVPGQTASPTPPASASSPLPPIQFPNVPLPPSKINQLTSEDKDNPGLPLIVQGSEKSLPSKVAPKKRSILTKLDKKLGSANYIAMNETSLAEQKTLERATLEMSQISKLENKGKVAALQSLVERRMKKYTKTAAKALIEFNLGRVPDHGADFNRKYIETSTSILEMMKPMGSMKAALINYVSAELKGRESLYEVAMQLIVDNLTGDFSGGQIKKVRSAIEDAVKHKDDLRTSPSPASSGSEAAGQSVYEDYDSSDEYASQDLQVTVEKNPDQNQVLEAGKSPAEDRKAVMVTSIYDSGPSVENENEEEVAKTPVEDREAVTVTLTCDSGPSVEKNTNEKEEGAAKSPDEDGGAVTATLTYDSGSSDDETDQ